MSWESWVEWLNQEWPGRAEPYTFTHNEYFRGWYSWKCRHCGIVRLEKEKTIERWFCDVCRVRNRLSTGPLNGDGVKE